MKRAILNTALLAGLLLLTSCGRNMYEQPRFEALEASPFTQNGAVNQSLLEGTISREQGSLDPALVPSIAVAATVSELPVPLTENLLARGQERYNIYCSPCHNFSGNGRGMAVQKGFPQPTSFHEQRLKDAPVGWYYSAMTNGFGRMYGYASRISPEDRWAIAAYIRALQLSQDAPAQVLNELGIDVSEQVTEASQ